MALSYLKRFLRLYAGLFLCAVSIRLAIQGGVGVTPWDVLHMGLADVTGIPDVCPGDEATILGPGLPAEEVARAAGTIPNELLSRLGSRVERVYL